jgi:Tfp pilus assembly protein PilF
MKRLAFIALLTIPLVIAAPACRRESPPDDTRERAYRQNNLGVALLEQFEYPKAADAFREALKIDGSLAMARLNLSLALLYALDLEAAQREAAAAAKLMPSAPEPHYVLGLIARAENRTSDARQAFERVRQIDGGDVGSDIHLGQIYLEERRYREAIEALRRAAAAEPYNVTAAYNLGLALTRGGQGDEGRKLLEQAQSLRGTGYAVTYGTGYLEQGRYAEAIASTGAESGLVEMAVPRVSFTPQPIGPAATAAAESPFGRSFAAADLTPAGLSGIAAGLGGGLALLDSEGDGDLDLFSASSNGHRLFRNDGGMAWTDVTDASGLAAPAAGVPIGCVAGDLDNDGRPDVFVLRYGGPHLLYHNDGAGRFSEITAKSALPAYPFLPGAAALTDVDHDGDLDLLLAGLADFQATVRAAAERQLVFPRDFAPAPLQLLRNNANGTFTDITAAARLTSATHAIAIVPTDFDNRRDIDLLVVAHDGPPLLFQNRRDGTFRDVAADVGLAPIGSSGATAVAAGDINRDEYPDFFFGQAKGGLLKLSDGRGRFTSAPAPAGADADVAAQLLDYDNDGLLDLLTWSASGAHLARNAGTWQDASATAVPAAAADRARGPAPRGLAVADLDGDGSTDFAAAQSDAVTIWRNSGATEAGRRSLRLQLRGRVSNRLGVGAKIQLRAGSLRSRLETSAATPAAAAADVMFGLGGRPDADVVRVLWPSGVLQAEQIPPPAASSPAAPLVIEELNRKPSSCPFLFTWNGERFEFVTDFMGAGEMGYWGGPGIFHKPDPIEYVRIGAGQLAPRDGKLELRVTNELEEALFVDRLQLLSVAHPADVEIHPNEGMADPPKPFKLFAVTDLRTPAAADDHGHDVTDRIARLDRLHPDDFALAPFRGYAARHALSLDLAPLPDRPVLLLTGWTDYAFSSDNVAAHHAGLTLMPPSLEVKGKSGRWRTAIADIGIPVGRPQTIPVDLGDYLQPGEHEVRVVTSMRIYWDRVSVARQVSIDGLKMRRHDPRSANLRQRGFSLEVLPEGRAPARFDYGHVTSRSPWKVMTGRYTREGDVRGLLAAADDMFVISKPGDEIAVEFPADTPLAPESGTQTFLLVAEGYSKEMDINSASPHTVEPLPFRAMSGYPYRAPERYPDTAAHRRYLATYNTRAVGRAVPSLEAVVHD